MLATKPNESSLTTCEDVEGEMDIDLESVHMEINQYISQRRKKEKKLSSEYLSTCQRSGAMHTIFYWLRWLKGQSR